MKVTIKETNKVEFETLMPGKTFIDPEYDDCAVFMVVEPGIEIIIKPDTDIVDEDEFYGYAVNLNDGGLFGFGKNAEVIPVNAELTATK